MTELWILIRVPLSAIKRAIDALKDAVSRGHEEAARSKDPKRKTRLRAEADEDDAAAEALKSAVREEEEEKKP